MKRILLSLIAAAVLAGPALAQKAPEAGKPAATIPIGVFFKAQKQGEIIARDRLIGVKVTGKDGQPLGEIEDLLLDPESKVIGVLMGVGGVLGVGEKQVAVRIGALKFTQADGKTLASLPQVTKETLAAVGPYERLVPQKTLLQKASDAAKEGAKKAQEAASAVAQKAKDAVKSPTGSAPQDNTTTAPAESTAPAVKQ